MRYRKVILSAIAIFILSCATVVAQGSSKSNVGRARTASARRTVNRALSNQKPKVSTEFGLGILGKYTFLDVVPIGNFPHSVTTNFGVGASLQFRVNFGRFFGIQPEVQYVFSQLKFQSTNKSYGTIKAKENLVQMPILFSIRAGIVDFNFGPVFRLMDNCNYLLSDPRDKSSQQCYLGNIIPLVTYAAGISVKLPKKMVIDLRYTGQFKDIESTNEFIWTLDENKQPESDKFRTRNGSIQLRFGVMF